MNIYKPHPAKNQTFFFENRKSAVMQFWRYVINVVWFPYSFYITMGWRTTWEWRICHVDGYLARSGEYEIAPTTGGRILEIYTIWGRSLGNCVFIINLAPYLGKPAFCNTESKEYACPGAWGLAKDSKLKNVGFWLSPHFRIFYILIGAIPRWGPLY